MERVTAKISRLTFWPTLFAVIYVVCADKLLPLLLQQLDSEAGTTQTIACSAMLALAYNNHKVSLTDRHWRCLPTVPTSWKIRECQGILF